MKDIPKPLVPQLLYAAGMSTPSRSTYFSCVYLGSRNRVQYTIETAHYLVSSSLQVMMGTSMTATLRALLFLAMVILQLRNSDGTHRARIARSSAGRDVRGTASNSSALDNNSGSAQSTCQKIQIDIQIPPPRAGCSQGVMRGVPICSGACNSYMSYKLSFPYKQEQCSCCTATTYRTSKRTVSFLCGNTNVNVSYNIAAVMECNCATCPFTRPVAIL